MARRRYIASTEEAKLRVAYEGVQIQYDEDSDKWLFVLRGVERKADTLKRAKEIISLPPPVNKVTFDPISAYFIRYDHGTPELVQVTSVAKNSSWESGQHVWISKNGQRSKESLQKLRVYTADTVEVVKQYCDLQQQIDRLEKSKKKLIAQMPRLRLPENLEE